MATYIFGEGPAATVSGTHKDTYLDLGFGSDDAYGGEATLQVYGSGVGLNAVTLLRFDISSIPAGETVSSAVLRVYLATAPMGNMTVSARALATDWGKTTTDEGATQTPAADSQATGNKSFANPTNTNWGGGGGFSGADYGASQDTETVVGGAALGTAYDFNLATLVGNWHTGAQANHGVVLLSTSNDILEFDSQESLTAAERPQLTVVTTVAPTPSTSSIATKISRTSIGVRV